MKFADDQILEWLEENGKETFAFEEISDRFEEYLNEVYGAVNICGQEFDAGAAYRELEPVGFRCGVSDWSAEEFEEIGGGYAYKSDYNDAIDALTEQAENEAEGMLEIIAALTYGGEAGNAESDENDG